ncbi:MAG: PAS domain-containing protein [Tannerella sp.]|jgi:nitrogen fixation/metabolism regulation signal transduction histidine kinase|nr:PAS domain-containing protein [Tannerella sp.]
MRIKVLFLCWGFFLVFVFGLVAWFAFRQFPAYVLYGVEALLLLAALFIWLFYRKLVKPMQVIADGMDLLKEQDFASRLGRVGQADADRIVEVFNKMMEQLKEERLHVREQNQILDLLVNASPLGVLMLDLDERISSVNRAGLQMLGAASETALNGRRLGELASPLAADLLALPPYSSQVFRLSDANVYKCTHATFVNQGMPRSFYLIELLTEEVMQAERKAYEKVIRMIAHEVNNTTAGITSTLETVEQAFPADLSADEELSDVFRVLIERCYRMNRFIKNFADVVRIPEARPERQDLNLRVDDCLRFMESAFRKKGIRLHKDLNGTPVYAGIDSELFDHALINIFKNAVEAIGQEGGDVYVATSGAPAALEVADNGAGIPPDIQAKLFTPFFSTKPEGQGVGLIFIREVLLKHHCGFSLATGDDGLTRFRIRFL